MKRSQLIGSVVAVLIVVLGLSFVWWAITKPNDETVSQPANQSTSELESDTPLGETITIVYTDDGYSPENVTASVNQQIIIKNESSRDMEFSSDDHPSHRDNSELNTETTAPGQSVTIQISEPGEWGFHDHIRSNFTGVITVQ